MIDRIGRVRGAFGSAPWTWRPLLWRLPLAVLLVLVCYRFDWAALKWVTSEPMLLLAPLVGVESHRLAFDAISVGDHGVQFAVSCTFIDVLAVGFVLIWSARRDLAGNLAILLAFAAGLFCLNQVRIWATIAATSLGSPWRPTDVGLGAIAYFIAWRVATWELLAPTRNRDSRRSPSSTRRTAPGEIDRSHSPGRYVRSTWPFSSSGQK